MCLYTVITDKVGDMTARDKTVYCSQCGIHVSFLNCSPLLDTAKGKPFFSILLDDRAGLASSYNILKTALTELNLIP